MKVYLAADHAGFDLKEQIKDFLISQNYQVVDCGATSFVGEDDYPDFIKIAAGNVSKETGSFAIVFGKSGTGEAIVANKFKNVKCVQGFLDENVKLAREHNNANILSLGSQFINFETAKKLTEVFLKTPFSGEERHLRRLSKLSEIEQENYA